MSGSQGRNSKYVQDSQGSMSTPPSIKKLGPTTSPEAPQQSEDNKADHEIIQNIQDNKSDDETRKAQDKAKENLPRPGTLVALLEIVIKSWGDASSSETLPFKGFKTDLSRGRAEIQVTIRQEICKFPWRNGISNDDLPLRQNVLNAIRSIWPGTLGDEYAKPLSSAPGTQGWTFKFNWQRDDNFYISTLVNLKYVDGYPITVEQRTIGEFSDRSPPDSFGRVWYGSPALICLMLFQAKRVPHIVNFRLLALILSTLATRGNTPERTDISGKIMDMLQLYAGHWYALPRHAIGFRWPYMHYHFLIRHFALEGEVPDPKKKPKKPDCLDGICCYRETGTFSALEDKSLTFVEHRTWIAIKTTSERAGVGDRPYYMAILLSDSKVSLSSKNQVWEESNLFPCGGGTGIALFQLMVWDVLRQWSIEWNETLDAIDNVLRVTLDDVLDPKKTDDYMFDDSFEHSPYYFKVLQILRKFGDTIHGSLDDLKAGRKVWDAWKFDLHKSQGTHPFLNSKELIASNWDTVVSYHQLLTKELLSRVEMKTEEVKSLRDGLLAATTLREATRGLELNRYILVFTILTIFYLPLTFVATLFGMHLFDKETSSQNQRAFYATIILAAFITYGLSGFVLWEVSPKLQRATFWKGVKDIFKTRPRLPQEKIPADVETGGQ